MLTGGGGVPLQPTRRFFNLKQLDLTPPATPFIPLTGDSPNISHAAYGDAAKGVLVVHFAQQWYAMARVTLATSLPAATKNIAHPSLTNRAR